MKRAYVVNQADLRMDGNLAMNVKRVLPVTQADVATAAQQGIFWNVKRYEVVNTLDNLRGGTQRILKVNAAAPGVQRAFLTSATTIVTVLGVPPLVLPDAVEGDLVSLKAFGGTEQGLPAGYTALTFIENSATTLVPLGVSFGTSNFKMEITAVVQNGSLNLFQSQTSGGLTRGIGGSSANTIYGKAGSLNDVSITANNYRTAGHKYTIAFTAESGTGTLKVDDLTASTTETVTGTYTTGVDSTEQICLFGNTQAQYVGAGTQIFGAKLWKDGALVLDLVPSRQGATKGFFDLVSRTFKTASTGTLLAGADTTLAPTPDAPMDIVCNNGVLKYSRNKVNVIADNIAVGKYISAQGVLSDSEYNFTYTPYVPVKPNTTYTLSFSSPIYFSSVSEYSSAEDAGFVVRQTKYSTSLNEPFDLTEFTFTTGATTNYIHFGLNMYKLQTLTINDVLALNYMLAESATAVPYAPYVSVNGGIYTDGLQETIAIKDDQNTTVSTATCEDLLSIGTYTDEQEVISGSVTRKVGVKVLDGTEDWGSVISTKFYWDTNFAIALDFSPTLCSHYQSVLADRSSGVGNNQTSLFKNLGKGRIVICDPRFTTVADFKQYLANQYAAGTPVIVIYPLATPTTESVAGQTLQTTQGDNVAEITQASLSGLELQVTYMAGVSLTIEEVEDAQLSPDVEVTIQ